MVPKKVLWISMYTPVSFAPSAGGQTFNYYFKKFESDNDFEIRLISCGKYVERERVERELSQVPHHIVYWGSPDKSVWQKITNVESKISPWNRNANLISNSDVDEILITVEKYLQEGFRPEIIILEWTSMVVLTKKIHELCPEAMIVASEHDVTYIGYERKSRYFHGLKGYLWKQKYKWEKKKELDSLKMCDLVLPHNVDNIENLVSEGLDRKKIMWLVPYFNNMSSCVRSLIRKDILFFGAMARAENYLSAIWFIDNVLPLISDLNVRFVILGSNPPGELTKLESDKIHITGFVESVVPYFESSMCMVAPLVLGAGIKVKVIEGMSSGMPILTNDIGIEGIHASDGSEFFYCVNPEDYADVIRNIYYGKCDVELMSQNAKKFIENEFSYEKCQLKYKQKLVDHNRER